MEIIFYNTSDSPNTINKELNEVIILDGYFRDAVDIISPIINIDVSEFDVFNNVNYCYIAEFQRYYFVNNIIIYRTGTITVELSVDVLQSFKSDIMLLTGYINQQTQNINLYYDADYVNQINKEIEIYKSDVILPNTSTQILNTIGG